MESRKKQAWDPNKKPQPFGGPKKAQTAKAAPKSTIHLITNNFKIKSKNHGVIYTYKVDFLEDQKGGGQLDVSSESLSTVISKGSLGADQGLQTFQKFRIMKTLDAQLKQIFFQYVFVGANLFSTTALEEQVVLQTAKPLFQRHYTVWVEQVSSFHLDELGTSKMEDHPFALSFINSIIKSILRSSNLK